MGVRTTGGAVTTLIAQRRVLSTLSANLFNKIQIHAACQVQRIHMLTLKVYFQTNKRDEYYHKSFSIFNGYLFAFNISAKSVGFISSFLIITNSYYSLKLYNCLSLYNLVQEQ
jgi:hypothetical protein